MFEKDFPGFSIKENKLSSVFDKNEPQSIKFIETDILILPDRDVHSRGLYGGKTADLYKALSDEFSDFKVDTLDDMDKVVVERLDCVEIVLPILSLPVNILCSIGASVFANFICDRVKRYMRIGRESDTSVKINLHVTESEKNVITEIAYKGSVAGLDKLEPLLKTLTEEGEDNV